MATSESDADFESADEELGRGGSSKRNTGTVYWQPPSTVDSESDDGIECVQRMPYRQSDRIWETRSETLITEPDVATGRRTSVRDKRRDNVDSDVKVEDNTRAAQLVDCAEKTADSQKGGGPPPDESGKLPSKVPSKDEAAESEVQTSSITKLSDDMRKEAATRTARNTRSKQRESSTKKLGSRITRTVDETAPDSAAVSHVADSGIMEQTDECCLVPSLQEELLESTNRDVECKSQMKARVKLADDHPESLIATRDLSEMDMPEELKSDKKFKEVFQPEGWEGLGDIELPDELTEDKLQPVMERLSLPSKESETSLGNWGNWGSWGVSSLINTATASVSTLTTHVSQGLTLLEGTIGIQDPVEPATTKQDEDSTVVPDDAGLKIPEREDNHQSSSTFGLSNLISGVSSITKLVESTGSKVMTGGLDTLEAIGKKTMEVLQEGDPGLKKKRAFFMNQPEKPILSQVLREARERAAAEEKTIEERELARKVHFESLFDDYQGLVHLEALEMLSKQCNMKIQQCLVELNAKQLTSLQETLEEIEELFDLDSIESDDEERKTESAKTLKDRLKKSCADLDVDITYDKLNDVCAEAETYLAAAAASAAHSDQEVFQRAISTLAQFTAFSVERFHKTAELILVKERCNLVYDADALIQLTGVLSGQINSLANSFCDTLNKLAEAAENAENINANITTIFLEAANAISYVKDAFRLFIPIFQAGVI